MAGRDVEARMRAEERLRRLTQELEELKAKLRKGELKGFDLGRALSRVDRLESEILEASWDAWVERAGLPG